MISALDLAWAAGFLEGEGSFVNKGVSIAVTCPQVELEPLQKLQQLLGGKIYQSEGRIYRWYINGSVAAGVMMTLYSFMHPKRRNEIEHCLATWKTHRTIGIKESPYCIHGHDKRKTGTYLVQGKYLRCAECRRERARKDA